jgi:LemA protein
VKKWLIPVGIIVVLLLVVVAPLIGSYNGLVEKEERVDQSFSNLDAVLQRRADLIPNLANSVKAILKQEQAVFGEIARARTQYAGARTPEQKVEASDTMSNALARLLVIVEQYPQLRSNENVRDLMVQIEGTENRVTQARRDYNETATDYNITIRRFPRSIVAGIFGFDRKPLFEAAPEDRDAPDIGEILDTDDEPAPAATG